MATPTPPSLIIRASATYDLLRATLSGVVMIAAAIVFFDLRLELDAGSLAVSLIALVGLLASFASPGVAVAAFTVIFKRPAAMLGLLVAGLALLGGVYFPVEVFPPSIEAVANALPFTWGLDALRASLLGGEVEGAQIVALFGSAALLLPLATVAFVASVGRARRTGSLATY